MFSLRIHNRLLWLESRSNDLHSFEWFCLNTNYWTSCINNHNTFLTIAAYWYVLSDWIVLSLMYLLLSNLIKDLNFGRWPIRFVLRSFQIFFNRCVIFYRSTAVHFIHVIWMWRKEYFIASQYSNVGSTNKRIRCMYFHLNQCLS